MFVIIKYKTYIKPPWGRGFQFLGIIEKVLMNYLVVILIYAALLLPFNYEAYGNHEENKANSFRLYPDEYSELDELPADRNATDNNINQNIISTLERSRLNFIQAQKMIANGDTAVALKYYDESLQTLYSLLNYPNIENNEDFTDLALTIVEDYESILYTLSKVDEDAPFFVIRNMIEKELENVPETVDPVIIPLETKETAQAGSDAIEQSKEYTIPMPDNQYVQKSIETFTKHTWSKKWINQCLTRMPKWFPMIKRIIEEENMPPELAYLSVVESGLNPTVVSRAKAVGLWQFMSSTGKMYNLNSEPSIWVDERRNPEKATRAAMRHLRDLYYRFGDWHLAMAAYNCGEGCVSRRVKRSNKDNPDFWDVRKMLPKETRWYVPKFIAITRILEDPEKYGFSLDTLQLLEEYEYETITLTEPVNLKALAKCVNIELEDIQELNTELTRLSTPPNLESYELRIPVGTKQMFVTNFAALTSEEKRPWVIHNVKRRETLSSISRKYGTDVEDLVSLNKLTSVKSKLRRGQDLIIPIDAEEYAKMNSVSGSGSYAGINGDLVHTVRRGESLGSISRKYGIRIAEIRNLNNIPYSSDRIHIGQRLLIAKQVEKKEKPKIAMLERPKIVKHKVKSGETLAKIADMYDVSVSSIKTLNRLKGTKIINGQALKIQTMYDKKPPSIAVKNSTPKSDAVTHKVRRGETIGTIAARYGVTEKQLRAWNSGKIRGNTIYTGSRLKIYDSGNSKGSYSADNRTVKTSAKYYNIRRGDTLHKIAKKFGVSVNSIMAKNKSLSEKRLQVGRKIRIQ